MNAKDLATEEPYELIAHVRICGGPDWVTIGPTRKPSLKSGPDQSRLHTSRTLDVPRFSSRLNSAVRRRFRERAKVLVMEAIFYKADISNSDLVFG